MRAWVALAVIVLLVGPADAVERVVFCTGDATACARGKTLGRAAQQSWAVVDDRDLLVAAAARKAVPPILYATRSDYEDAVAGLAVDERARAVLARRKVVATDPWGQLPAFFPGVVRADLLSLAAAGDARTREAALAAASALGGGVGRFSSLRVGERWDIALHSLAALRAEVPDGPLAMRLAQEEEALAAGGADSRGARTGSAPLVVPVVRVYFVARIVSPMRRTPLFVDRPFMTWNGGTIVAMRPEERDQPRWKGHEAHLVYYDKGAFLEDMETLTETQLYRELRRRLAGPPRSEHDELVASLAFEHAVQVHLLAATAGADGASTAAAWRRAAATAADNFAAIAAALNPHAADEAPRRLARLQADLALASAVAKLPPGPTDSARLLDDAQAALSPLLP